jgi:hypothetical protein
LEELRETRRRSQFPEASVLTVRQVERAPEMLFGDNGSVGRAIPQNQFTSDAEQLCDIPAFVAGFAAGERIIDDCQPRCHFTNLAEARRQFAE